MSVSRQLSKLLEAKNISVPDVARHTGIARSTLYSLLSRDSSTVRPKLLNALAAYLEVPTEFFFEEWEAPKAPNKTSGPSVRGAAASGDRERCEHLEDVTRKIIWKLSGEIVAVQINDESMLGAYDPGEVIMVNLKQTPILGQNGLFEYGGKTLVRTLGKSFLLAANALFRPLPLVGDWKSLGTVVGSMMWQ